MSLLEIHNLTKSYGSFKAVDDLSICIQANQVYGFIGRNGAGKTTTINCILSLINFETGNILYKGEPVFECKQHFMSEIGYVPDVPGLPGYLTAHEFLDFIASLHHIEPTHRIKRIQEVMKTVGLEDNQKKISGYSRGMKQRLAIAQALINKPKLLIMDEPTSALDPIGRKEILEIIKTLKKEMTVFYSTHILEDAQRVCDRIAFIEQGKMILEDSLSNLLSKNHVIRHHLITNYKPEDLLEELRLCQFTHQEVLTETGVIYAMKAPYKTHELLKYLFDKDIDIIALSQYHKTLEDVFMEVLHENNA